MLRLHDAAFLKTTKTHESPSEGHDAFAIQGRSLRVFKLRALATVSVAALAASAFTGQSTYAQQTAQAEIGNIIVTGTRIVRDGYEAPTPLTVIGPELLEAQSTTGNVADTLNTMPVFALSASPASAQSGVSSGRQGLNTLNLRGLGGTRTLTLLDGQRSVPSLFSGEVDANNFPQQLLQRVDVVTGGASAVYGSDAVAGVVNFVLDKEFTGIKGEVSGGLTTYGDNRNFKASVAGGFPFSNDRGHVLLSGEIADQDGVYPGAGKRGWNRGGWGIMVNPNYTSANGEPEYLVRPEISLSNATHGGIIVSGPLRGTAFGEGGVPYQFNYGSIVNDPWMQGGDWQATEIRHDRSGSLEPAVLRRNLFARASYDVTDNINVFGQVSWAATRTYTYTWPAFQAGNGPTILSGNPFIPDSVQSQMDALGLVSFRIGSMNYDIPTVENYSRRATNRYVAGIDGSFSAFNSDWSWNAYFQHGATRSTNDAVGAISRAEYANAVDAVLDPNGNIVCRSTLTDPGNGCHPWNPLGTGVNGARPPGIFNIGNTDNAALNYITGTAHVNQRILQNVYAGSLQGEAFSTWAGPISIALSIEHRTERAKAVPDPNSGNWFTGNFQAFNEKLSVTEGAFETVVPIASDQPWAESLDLNAAVRATDYSSSGYVTTWKVGATYAPVNDVRFRITRSRDIRAPNFLELFASNNSGFRSAFDPFTGTIPQFFGRNQGNPNLDPEKGDTFEVGVVFQPSAFPGFSASIDYWDIDVSGSIGGANDDQILQFCFQGLQQFCGNIIRDAGGNITELIQSPFNLASEAISGIDFESSYSTPLDSIVSSWLGDVSFNGRATVYLKSNQNDGLGNPTIDTLGHGGQRLNGPPKWRLTASMSYTYDALSTSLTARAQSAMVIDNRNVECLSSCPAPVAGGHSIEDNSLPSAFYLDGSISYRFDVGASEIETFFNVRNLLNKDPGIVPQGPTDFTYVYPQSRGASGYDLLGRVMRAGVRFRM